MDLKLSLANHSAKEDSVSCNFKEKSAIPSGNLFIIFVKNRLPYSRLLADNPLK